MKSTLNTTSTLLVAILLIAAGPSWLRGQEQAGGQLMSAGDVDTLLAPIALYPDPLLSQMLPAATYPDDIQAAASLVARHPRNYGLIDAQPWDLSVKSVAHYPSVIEQMAADMDWTVALGQAYGQQRLEVFDAVQRLRQIAWDAGTLRSTPEQRVFTELGVIRIVPAHAQYVYVPRYNPEVVYVAGPPHRPGLMTFSAGFMIGAWLNSDLDWRGRRVYYHGWAGPGWIAYSRGHVHMTPIYVHDRYRQWRWYNPQPRFHGRPVVRTRVYVDRHYNRYQFNRNRPGHGGPIGPQHRPPVNERFHADYNRGPGRAVDGPHRPPVVTDRGRMDHNRPAVGGSRTGDVRGPGPTGGRPAVHDVNNGRTGGPSRFGGGHDGPGATTNRTVGGGSRFGGNQGPSGGSQATGGHSRFGGGTGNRPGDRQDSGNQATGNRNRFGGGGGISGGGNRSGGDQGGGGNQATGGRGRFGGGSISGGGSRSGGDQGGGGNQATGGRGRFGSGDTGGANRGGNSGGGQGANSNSDRRSGGNDNSSQGASRSGGGPRGDGEGRKSRH